MSPPSEFEVFVQQIRPELHRYCARMLGSAIDAEDVVQEALAKAYTALPTTSVTNMRGWLFRIAHNKAIDHLRHASQQPADYLDERAVVIDPGPPLAEGELVSLALAVFVKLAPKQRSCVILKDVMGYSLAEISELLDATVPEIKAALHRGRTRLRELAPSARADGPGALDEQERELLARYIDRFNARDFDAVRAMLADEVRLELFNRASRRGAAAVGEYFVRYDLGDDWQLTPGTVEGHPAILVFNPREPSAQPAYFMLLAWEAGLVLYIRDYRYTPYIMGDVVIAGADRDTTADVSPP
jgi:RNA polymerase sigma-70 factor (ECF subfamily)